jgi:hypothetical protein
MFISPDADGKEVATGILSALGRALIGLRQSADTTSDRVVESMQEIVSELKKEQRRLFTGVHVDGLGTLSATNRRQVAARRSELAVTSRSVEEPFDRA